MGVFDAYIEATEALLATYRDQGRTDLDLLRDILRGENSDETDPRRLNNQALEMIAYLSMRNKGGHRTITDDEREAVLSALETLWHYALYGGAPSTAQVRAIESRLRRVIDGA